RSPCRRSAAAVAPRASTAISSSRRWARRAPRKPPIAPAPTMAIRMAPSWRADAAMMPHRGRFDEQAGPVLAKDAGWGAGGRSGDRVDADQQHADRCRAGMQGQDQLLQPRRAVLQAARVVHDERFEMGADMAILLAHLEAGMRRQHL